ncbi:S66 peptidase family protein [Cohnella sp.]|uniref:S66 family peptidase n=1 Tax=Cohnella sp. TaxID=1883426 RepID=UPI003564AE95
MEKIIYPAALSKGDYIAVTAPSSGVEEGLHNLLMKSKVNLEKLGFTIIEGHTIWTNDKCVSASKEARVDELERYLVEDNIKAVVPPWGGEFLMEILPLIDWALLRNQPPKWILGYSDISTFTFAYTLLTGHATAHGPNYVDIGSEQIDSVTSQWLDVLSTGSNGFIKQYSSMFYRSSWETAPDTPTKWKTLGRNSGDTRFSGRLIGGCLDTLSILVGTPYAPIEHFSSTYCQDEGIVWFLESCEMNAADIYRHLWQMKVCGWFNNTNGVLIGRAAGYLPRKNFELIDALEGVFGVMDIPVIYEVDIGHVPPQVTLINGAQAEIICRDGKGEITLTLS